MDPSTGSFEGEQTPLILVIDDCPAAQRLFKAAVSGGHVRMETAMSGADGLVKAEVFQPDLIVLDLNMPGSDGFEILKTLKNNPNTKDIPVLIVSGSSHTRDKVLGFDLGAIDFVAKPFEISELRARIRVALHTRMMVKMLSQRAQLDGLTGLYNRACFDQRLSEEHQRAIRSGQPMSLALIDLDHFKSINDTYGHSAGDEVLTDVSGMIRRIVRAGDIPCRYGGEELAIILPDTSTKHATLLCERIREQCERIVWSRHRDRPVTLSAGVAGTNTPTAHSTQAWLDEADKNLYQAKGAGRNRVISSDLGGAPLRVAS